MIKNIEDEIIKELAREKRNKYQRMWRKKNKEKVSQYQKEYWERIALEDLIEKDMYERYEKNIE